MAARWRLRSRRGPAKRDAEDGVLRFRYPFGFLFLAGWWAQQCAIAAKHQGEAGLNESNGSVTKVVSFPGAFGNAVWRQTELPRFRGRYCRPPAHRGREGRAPSDVRRCAENTCNGGPGARSFRARHSRRAACARNSKSRSSGSFDCIGFGDNRCFLQPHAVFDAAQMQHGVPAVGRLPQLCRGQFDRA